MQLFVVAGPECQFLDVFDQLSFLIEEWIIHMHEGLSTQFQIHLPGRCSSGRR